MDEFTALVFRDLRSDIIYPSHAASKPTFTHIRRSRLFYVVEMQADTYAAPRSLNDP